MRKGRIRQIYRLIKKAIKENDKSEIQEHHKLYVSLIDKAVKKSIYHKNKGSRKKSKMNLKVKNFVLGS